MSSLLLLSGGIDSVALAAWLRPKICLTVNYGQRAAQAELQSSKQVCLELGLKHKVLDAAIPDLGSGQMAGQEQSPFSQNSEFWPFRNQYLVTIASMLAMQTNCDSVFIGTVVTDKRHQDGSPAFLQALSNTLLIQEGNIRLVAPAIEMTTEQLVRKSGISEPILAWSHSCHTGNFACGKCPGCLKHSFIMHSLGINR